MLFIISVDLDFFKLKFSRPKLTDIQNTVNDTVEFLYQAMRHIQA